MNTQKIIIEISLYKDTPEYREALQKVADCISTELLQTVARKIDKLGKENFNKKLKTGLEFI